MCKADGDVEDAGEVKMMLTGRMPLPGWFVGILMLIYGGLLPAGVGDPQIRTDHPWYPGELSCSTFERLFATQADMFHRVVGHAPRTDEDRVLAAWMWRNLHYAHGEEGRQDLWGDGFRQGDTTTREYWTGLFAHGFGLCGTTHAQWTAELNALLGHGRSRTVGVAGHNACEVFLTGGAYGGGRWALLDHDVSTVVFDPTGSRLLSIVEIGRNLTELTDPDFKPERQRRWPLGGLHRDDPQAYAEFKVVEHLPGYAGPPPMLHLRRGETLDRYFQPGLADGQTFVFWGRNYRTEGIPGPERSRTWVNQPERFRGSPEGSGFRPGQARFGNAVYRYVPDFRDGGYREAVVDENPQSVTLEFQTPFIIAATPPDDSDWGIYETGCRNGLTIRGDAVAVAVEISVDRGATWHGAGTLPGQLDLTDFAKGRQQYRVRLNRPARELAEANIEITTVCQANPAAFPRLKDDGSLVTFAASGQAVTSLGPNRDQVRPGILKGGFDSPGITVELKPPRGHMVRRLHTAAHVASSNPPDPAISYQIESSRDGGRTWNFLVRDWRIVRQGEEPADFWSQSLCHGACDIPGGTDGAIQVRFRNDGGKRYLRAEAHLTSVIPRTDPCRVRFVWSDDEGSNRSAERVFEAASGEWHVETGKHVVMKSVRFAPIPR